MRAAPAAKHGGKALPFGSRAQRRCGLAAGAGGRAGLTAGHSAGVALRRGVCTGVALQPGRLRGTLFGDPKMPHDRRQSMAGKRSLSAAGHSADVALRPGQAAEPALRPGQAAEPALRRGVCAGRFSAIPKCRMAGGVVFAFQRGCPGGERPKGAFCSGRRFWRPLHGQRPSAPGQGAKSRAPRKLPAPGQTEALKRFSEYQYPAAAQTPFQDTSPADSNAADFGH